ncbi:MAG: hypothetical protein D6736_11945 [Nitrospinota bacterium]|nr:MAG: hypothetical protein D6736_11945 [Nitrospinota bacterium]
MPATDNTPSCMSCHRAHGSVNPFGLIYTFNDPTNGGQLKIENGDTGTGTATIKATCNKCHKKGI